MVKECKVAKSKTPKVAAPKAGKVLRKQVEAELRETEDRYKALFELSLDLVYICDLQGFFTDANDVALNRLGYTREEITGLNFASLISEDQLPLAFKTLKDIEEAGFQKEMTEYEVRHKDGSSLYITTLGSAIYSNGNLIGIQSIARDITARKRIEDSLKVSEANYRQLYDSSPVAIYQLDYRTGKFSKANDAMCKYLGCSQEEITALNPYDIMTDESKQLFSERLNKIGLGEEVSANPEFEIIDKECKRRTVQLNIKNIYNAVGLLIGADVVAHDITERKQAEVALQDAQWRLESIIKGTHVGTWEWNVQTGATVFNDEWAQIIGYTLDELAPISISTWEKYAHPDDLQQSGELLERHFAGKLPYYDYDCRMKHKNGHWVWVQDRGRVETSTAEGKPLLMFGTHTDITLRKQAEIYREVGSEVLKILDEPGDLRDSIGRVIAALKTQTGFDAVGIRLQNGDDYPYFTQKGFPSDFLLTENTLIERAADGGVYRDENGNVYLECTCGLVISGKTDPANRHFTQGGSFWTSNSLPVLDSQPGKERRLRSRNRCIHEGYVSMALVPIRNKDRIVGLIHLNDRRQECFTEEIIELIEEMSSRLGLALMRRQMEEAQKQQTEEILVLNHEMSRFNLAAIDRELFMIELKREVNHLCGQLGEPPRYRIAEAPA